MQCPQCGSEKIARFRGMRTCRCEFCGRKAHIREFRERANVDVSTNPDGPFGALRVLVEPIDYADAGLNQPPPRHVKRDFRTG